MNQPSRVRAAKQPEKPAKNEFLIVKIERLVPDGAGLGFADGKTVFVPLAAPGDVCRVRVVRKKGGIAFAQIVEIVESSVDRVAPPCKYFGACGGCDFQQLNYPAQLRAKVEIIRDCLRRIGKIDWQNELKIVRSPNEFGYRTRAQWKLEREKFGYFEPNSHLILDIETCPILAAPLQTELTAQRAKLKFEKPGFSEIQAVSADDRVSQRFSNGKHEYDENFYAANRELAEDSRSQTAADNNAAREISFSVNNFEYKFSAATFFQVNHSLLPEFVETALGAARGDLALDLFCGVGLFALPLAPKFKKVIGVEGNQTSIRFALQNAVGAKLENIEFYTNFVGEWLADNAAELPRVDFVLLDPPRTGAEKQTIASLIELRPKEIVYVSCNPATLARDLRILCENNFTVEQITAFDFFPQTHHVETVVRLSSSKSAVQSSKSKTSGLDDAR